MIKVALSRIADNPYQPRQAYGEIEELAGKIESMRPALPETLGLIHVPNGRLVDKDGELMHCGGSLPADADEWYVQLAEGHRRLRAFRLLAEEDEAYGQMPVAVVDLIDEAMDDIAWDENQERQDLSAVEEARALKRSMEQFGLSQTEVAERRGLARSTVANKVRLLQLPDDLLEAIHEGRITERHGLAFLPVLEIGEADLEGPQTRLSRDRDFTSWQVPHPEALRERLAESESGDWTADEVRGIVERIKRRVEDVKRAAEERAADKQMVSSGASPSPTPRASPQLGEERSPRPGPDLRATAVEPRRLEMPPKEELAPDLPDVVVTVRLARGQAARPERFTLSVGEEGAFPQFFNGAYPGELGEVLGHALELFVPGEDGERVLVEVKA